MQKDDKTLERIADICFYEEGDRYIRGFVEEMNKQGIIKMFIDFSKLEELIRRMVALGIITQEHYEKFFKDADWSEIFVYNLRPVFAQALIKNKNVNESNILEFLEKFSSLEFVSREEAFSMFSILGGIASKYINPYKEVIALFLEEYDGDEEERKELQNLIDEIVPNKLKIDPTSKKWIRTYFKTYLNCDFSVIFELIDTEKTIKAVFERGLELEVFVGSEAKMLGMGIQDIEILTLMAEEHFKALILDVIFNNELKEKKKSAKAINRVLDEMAKKRPDYIRFMYSHSALYVKLSEIQRINNLLQKRAAGISTRTPAYWKNLPN